MNHLCLPINIARSLGGYTLRVTVGSENTPLDLLLDTGSSTLAIKLDKYRPEQDSFLKPTSYAQDVTYGLGAWAGPVVQTHIRLGGDGKKIGLADASTALIATAQAHTFDRADGIFGLAYHTLNKAYNLSGYLEQTGHKNTHTYPWQLALANSPTAIRDFKKILWQQPEHDIQPYFTALDEHGLLANRFAFSVKRAIAHADYHSDSHSDHPSDNHAAIVETMAADPLNQGMLVLGDGEKASAFYRGTFRDIKVVHDAYYNTNLLSVRVEGFEPMPAEALQQNFQSLYFSNAIVDTGSSYVLLPHHLYQYLLNCFGKLNADWPSLIAQARQLNAQQQGLDASLVQLERWPSVHFVLEGSNGPVSMECRPEHYWQLNAGKPGWAFFCFADQLPRWPNQSILGLPLLADYYCVFDREVAGTGVIRIAAQA